MIFASILETYFLYFIGVYIADQIWNLFMKDKTQTQIFVEALVWAPFFILLDKIWSN